eukprot:jgi/Hompol1/3941/HPOL_006845-RA
MVHLTPALNALLAAADTAHNASLYWGTYRPSLYFGTRTRSPDSLLTGLMWFGAAKAADQPWNHIRHACHHDDNLSGYAWNKHDGRSYGSQQIHDHLNNLTLTTEFLKTDGSAAGGDWVVRIKGTPLDPENSADISLVFYAGLDDATKMSVQQGD